MRALVLSLSFLLLVCQCLQAQPAAQVRIACIGNSITYGAGIENRDRFSYPAQLNALLAPIADVRNFGVSGRTLLRHGDYPYWNESAFHEAIAFKPNIVIIKLGTNDSKPQNWKFAGEFVYDYEALIDSFSSLPSHPDIFACYPVPVFSDHWGIRDSVVTKGIVPKIDSVSQARHVRIIDLYRPLKPYAGLFPDGVHPNAAGANLMAIEVLKNILGSRLLGGKLPPYKNPGLAESARTEDLLKRMTMKEKLAMLGGLDDFYIRPNSRLGIPRIKMADGPLGVRNYGEATAYPAGICMAAAWDTALERQVGTMVGREARAKGVQIMLAPAVNIYRAPMCGRNFEYFGEDPFLAGATTAAYVRGVQSQGVVATVKHFALNNQEYDRMKVSSDADERTTQEIYLPAFRSAVDAKVGAVMCAYNLVNGTYCANNTHLLTDILRQQFGFDGFVMSDWGATHDGVGSVNAGLDLEMPSGRHMNLDTLLPALKEGRITSAEIDEKIRRMLRIMFRFGFFDRDQEVFTPPEWELNQLRSECEGTALQAAREGIVLLKNSSILPLNRSRIREIAVIGPNAHPAVTGGGGSSRVEPYHSVSVLEGISRLAGDSVSISYLPGIRPVTEDVFLASDFMAPDARSAGLEGQYYSNMNLQGTPAFTRTDRHINFQWKGDLHPGFPMEHFSVRWTGTLIASRDDDYDFIVRGDDGYRLYLDDKLLIDDWQDQGSTALTSSAHLDAGRAHKVILEYYQNEGDAEIALGYRPVSQMISPRLREVASRADAVVLCVGFDESTEAEGGDRTFALPSGQERLIVEAASANPHTVVLLNAGGNVDMTRWIDRVPALLHCWYPGQEGGRAVAEILFGNVNPSGKLPATFEKRWEDNAAFASYYADSSKHVKYAEGVFTGYRHFDRDGIEPRFPFGFGLSYTTFEYRNLRIERGSGRNMDVTFDVANTGRSAGDEVAQVYVGQSSRSTPTDEPRPPKELKGFVRVPLQPGETKAVDVKLDESSFSYFNGKKNMWVVQTGDFEILVGSSSRDIRLRQEIRLE